MVRYRVRPEHVEANEKMVRAVYDELERTSPSGLRYATFKLDDGVSFLHIAMYDTPEDHFPPAELESFAEFRAGLDERCEESPQRVELQLVGAYRLPD
jgi:hypothetical protein